MANRNPKLLSEINQALDDIRWGSVEIYVQNDEVTQITVKNIRKTKTTTESIIKENGKNKEKLLTNKKQTSINVVRS